MSLTSSVVTEAAALESLRAEWEDLLSRSATDEPMLSPLWLLAWWRVFGGLDGRRLLVLVCRDAGRLVGLAPLITRKHRYPPAIDFTRVELLGTGEHEADEICSEYVGVVAERGAEANVADALATALADGALGRWDELVLPAMDACSEMPTALSTALGRAGIEAELESSGSAPYIELPSTFAAYLGAMSSSSRYLVTRSLRDFERWAGEDAELRVAASRDEVDEGRRVLLALHAERWSGGGAFASPRFRAFHDAVMPGLFARGALELGWLSVRGAPVAIAYGIVWRDKVYFYQAGRSPSVPKGVRPGIALHALLVRRAIEQGRREYDFLEGHSRYKRQLATSARAIVRLRAARDRAGVRERARLLCERGIEEARMLRRVLSGAHAVPPSIGPLPAPTPPAVLHGDVNMLRCFAGTDVRAVVVSPDPDSPSFFSRHGWQRRVLADARVAPQAALSELCALGRLFGDRPALFYGDDAMLLLVSRNREALAPLYRFLLPPAELVEGLVDKLRFAAIARERGLPAPRTVTSWEASSAAEIARIVPPPVILKPFSHLGFYNARSIVELGVGPVKALTARTEEELARMIDRIRAFSPDFVVQEYIPGGEDNVVSFHAYVDARGRRLGSFTGRKIRTYPRLAGISTYLEVADDPALARAGMEAIEKLGIVGVVKLDYKRDPRSGRLYLLEANPRFSLWNHLGAAAGVNLPLIAYRDLIGAKEEPARLVRPGLRWLSFGDDLRTFLRSFRPAGELTLASWLLSLRGPKVYDVFAWDDPSPFVMSVRQALGGARRRGRSA